MLFVFFRIATIIAFVKTFFDPNEISPGKNDYEAIKDADVVNHGPGRRAGDFAIGTKPTGMGWYAKLPYTDWWCRQDPFIFLKKVWRQGLDREYSGGIKYKKIYRDSIL